jgi:ribosomal protein L4
VYDIVNAKRLIVDKAALAVIEEVSRNDYRL